jgi:hypothetical protein
LQIYAKHADSVQEVDIPMILDDIGGVFVNGAYSGNSLANFKSLVTFMCPSAAPSGPNNSGVLNKHGGWVIFHALKNVWSGISVSLDFLLNLSAMNFFQRLKITTINDKK